MEDNQHYATVNYWDNALFLERGAYQFLSPERAKLKKGLFSVAYTGFGWMLIKKGVFESFEYPWFRPVWKEFNKNGTVIKEFTMEDVAFCQMAKEKGYDIWIDPDVVVGHEKMMVLV
jgi:hypothetical protein